MELHSGFVKPKREAEEVPRVGRMAPVAGGAASSCSLSVKLGGQSSVPSRSPSALTSGSSSRTAASGSGGRSSAASRSGGHSSGRSSSSGPEESEDSSDGRSSSSAPTDNEGSSLVMYTVPATPPVVVVLEDTPSPPGSPRHGGAPDEHGNTPLLTPPVVLPPEVLDKIAEIASQVSDLHKVVHKLVVDFEYHWDNVQAELDLGNARGRRIRKLITARDRVAVCAFVVLVLVVAAMVAMSAM